MKVFTGEFNVVFPAIYHHVSSETHKAQGSAGTGTLTRVPQASGDLFVAEFSS